IANCSLLNEVHDADTISEVAIVCALSVTEITEDILLNFVSKFLLDMFLDTAQHERLQNHVEALQLVLIELRVALRVRLDILGKPLTELIMRIEQGRHDKVQQSPQLLHIVLNGRTRKKQAVSA